MTLSIIVATDNFNAIGYQNKIPWHLPDDLKFFKEKTLGKQVIMGRKTFDSIIGYLGKPLPERQSVIFSRTKSKTNIKDLFNDNTFYPNDVIEFLESAKNSTEEVMVIGGEEIYRLTLPYVDTIYLTEVNTTVKLADAYFVTLRRSDWSRESSRPVYKEDNTLSHTFITYKRIN